MDAEMRRCCCILFSLVSCLVFVFSILFLNGIYAFLATGKDLHVLTLFPLFAAMAIEGIALPMSICLSLMAAACWRWAFVVVLLEVCCLAVFLCFNTPILART